jgi:hypothetical protein
MVGGTDHSASAGGAASVEEMFERGVAAEYVRAMQDWMEPVDSRFYSIAALVMFMKLIADPAIKRADLAYFMETTKMVSRSTAERLISSAKEAGHIEIVDSPDKRGHELFLSAPLKSHFSKIFLRAVDRSRSRIQAFEESRGKPTSTMTSNRAASSAADPQEDRG